jgi:hypothetical protein
MDGAWSLEFCELLDKPVAQRGILTWIGIGQGFGKGVNT